MDTILFTYKQTHFPRSMEICKEKQDELIKKYATPANDMIRETMCKVFANRRPNMDIAFETKSIFKRQMDMLESFIKEKIYENEEINTDEKVKNNLNQLCEELEYDDITDMEIYWNVMIVALNILKDDDARIEKRYVEYRTKKMP